MSNYTEFMASATAKQLEVAQHAQDVVLTYVRTYIENAPALSEFDASEPVKNAFRPAFSFLGSPGEMLSSLVKTSTAWLSVSRQFADKLFAEVARIA